MITPISPLRFTLLLLLSGCASTSPVAGNQATAPVWYATQELQPDGFWVGYGDAVSLEEAKTLARADLSRSLSSRISSRMQVETDVEKGELVNHEVTSHVEEVSHATLSDLVTLKSEHLAGRYYVILGYDYQPLTQRVVSCNKFGIPRRLFRLPILRYFEKFYRRIDQRHISSFQYFVESSQVLEHV